MKRLLVGEALGVEGYELELSTTLQRIVAELGVEPHRTNGEDFYSLIELLAAMLARIKALE